MNMKKATVILGAFLGISLLGACGFNVEQHEEIGEETSEGAAGTMLAGQEAPEQVGVIKSAESAETVVITVGGQDVTYRLSEDAKQQVENNEVAAGSEVTFTTYSIGDQTETIDTFLSK